jgi:peptidylprolyl isomerase
MAQAKNGNTVKVNYTGKLENGEVFDSSMDREPLEVTLGEGQVITGFEEALVGMSEDESKTVTIPAENAYGPYQEEMVMEVEKERFPEGAEPAVGQRYQVSQTDGQAYVVTVTGVEGSKVTLDANHPLAGKDLTFDIQLVGIS